MYIAHDFNCWFTNVVEAFIDIGVKSIINKLMQKDTTIKYGSVSAMSNMYIGAADKNAIQRTFKARDYFRPDLYVLPGMFASKEFADSKGGTRRIAQSIVENGGT